MAALHPVLRFTLLCTALVLGVLVVGWGASGFSAFGMTGHGVAALVLGAVFSVVLATALMGLLFHSERRHGEGARFGPPRRGRRS